jgi:hypothetical protein
MGEEKSSEQWMKSKSAQPRCSGCGLSNGSGVPLEDVQDLAGHADPRTTRLYDRCQKQVTRNIVERISV